MRERRCEPRRAPGREGQKKFPDLRTANFDRSFRNLESRIRLDELHDSAALRKKGCPMRRQETRAGRRVRRDASPATGGGIANRES